MPKILKSIFPLFICMTMMLMANSCEVTIIDNDPFVGVDWVFTYDDRGYVPEYMVDYYSFYGDHTGRYGYYDDYGYWNEWMFSWYTSGDRLDIQYYDGNWETYYFYFSNGDLILWDGYNTNWFNGYVRYY